MIAKMIVAKPPKRRSPGAASLRSPAMRPRVVKSKRTYSRKGRDAAVARDHRPRAEEAYETKCRAVECARRTFKRREMLDAIFEKISEIAIGSTSAANSLVLMSRMVERYAKDRADVENRPGETPYPKPPGAES